MSIEPRLPLLRDGALLLGLDLTQRQIEQFQRYYEVLVDWNSRVNLTAITEYEAVQVRHFLDSLSVGVVLLDILANEGERPQEPPPLALADIGTGAGFPGVPLKILRPHLRLTLADSIGKKTAFLSALCEELRLDGVEVVTARAEEMGQDRRHRERYDVVTARAVSSLPVLCEYCLPLAKVGGLMLAPKKGDISLEIQDAMRGARYVGGGPPQVHEVHLPGESDPRLVVAIRKEKPTPPGYPRRVGLAKSRPLGQEEIKGK
jgi:16S rRNA (guanine527-N7)-methyltransferase